MWNTATVKLSPECPPSAPRKVGVARLRRNAFNVAADVFREGAVVEFPRKDAFGMTTAQGVRLASIASMIFSGVSKKASSVDMGIHS